MKGLVFCLAIVLGLMTELCAYSAGPDDKQIVEVSETEAKFLVPDLTKLPADIVEALLTGRSHPYILRRGFVVQEYLPVTEVNLRRFFALLKAAGIPFGTPEQQAEFLKPGKAKEIRMMSKSIRIGDEQVNLYQATVKGAGGLSVQQLETPENLTDEQKLKIQMIFNSLRPEVTSVVRKVYFEPLATDHDGKVLLRKDGSPYTVELDTFIGKGGIEAGPIFINGEIEFHGATQAEAIAEAAVWQKDPSKRPPYFSQDLTEEKGVKSRDIAANGAPPVAITQALAPYAKTNLEIFKGIAHQFSTWADSEVTKLIFPTSGPGASISQSLGSVASGPKILERHPVVVTDPVVHRPEDQGAIRQFFKENGYVVVDRVSKPEERQALLALMDRVLAKNIERARRLGFMDLYHDDTLAQMRQNPTLYKVFADLFGEEKLWVVFDRVLHWSPTEGELPLPPHVDQNPKTHPDFFNVQAMLALKDMNEGTGTLALVPKSHRQFAEYEQWTKPGDGFVEFRDERALPFVALRLKEGQIVIWDSRTTHSRFRGEPTAPRYAALLTYTPAKDREDLRALRLKYFQEGIGWNEHEAGLRGTAGKKLRCEMSLRESPENLTDLGQKLYGVKSWFSKEE